MVRGGIERYVKTFPEGGFWKGKNYLFDRRLEQTPAAAKEKGETESWCSCCGVPWDTYRGQYKCSGKLPPPVGRCAVPVLVCAACIDSGRATAQASTLLCPLCTEGYVPPSQMPALEKAAVEAALRGFEELPAEQARGAEVVALVQEDRLVARSEEAVFQWVKRWWEAGARPEAELLAVLRHVRFAAMAEAFLRESVVAWPALQSVEGQRMVLTAVLPVFGGAKVVPRSGFGPRLIARDGERARARVDRAWAARRRAEADGGVEGGERGGVAHFLHERNKYMRRKE